MKSSLFKRQIIMFIVMVVIGILFNPMNILAYRFSDLYLSQTLFYGGLLMASNMIWGHEIVHYLSMGHFNFFIFCIGVIKILVLDGTLIPHCLAIQTASLPIAEILNFSP